MDWLSRQKINKKRVLLNDILGQMTLISIYRMDIASKRKVTIDITNNHKIMLWIVAYQKIRQPKRNG